MSGADHAIFVHSSKACRVQRNKVSVLKVSRGEIRDKRSPPLAILLSYDICRGVNMLLPLHNKDSMAH